MRCHINQIKRDFYRILEELEIRRYLTFFAIIKLPIVRDPEGRALRVLNLCNQFRFTKFGLFLSSKLIPKLMTNLPKIRIAKGYTEPVIIRNSIIIKSYVSKKEKGFLLVKFEKELEKILPYIDSIQERYHIIFLPSSISFFSFTLLNLAKQSDDLFYIMPVFERDKIYAEYLGNKCVMLPFNAASWVKQEYFSGYTGARDIDCLIVAIFAEFKRHWILFKVLKTLPKEVSVVCVGVPYNERTVETLRDEAIEYGVSDRVIFIEGPTQEDLRVYFQRAKVFCALTYKEGSFVAVAESLMSGTPVVTFKNSYFGTKQLINSGNGQLVTSTKELRKAILSLPKNMNNEMIRTQSQESFSSAVNCAKIEECLREAQIMAGLKWTNNIEPFYCVRQELYYDFPDSFSRTKKDYEWLKQNGINIVRTQKHWL